MTLIEKKHRPRTRKSPALILVVLSAAILLSLFHLDAAQLVQAYQAPQDDGSWSHPVNLSKSGSTSQPAIHLTSDTWNVVWHDVFSGSRISQFSDGGEWSTPASTAFPFRQNLPRFLRGPEGLSVAFWIDSAGRNTLFSSRVQNKNFDDRNSWEPGRQISLDVLAFDVTLDANGRFHLVYLTNIEAPNKPAGVYYRMGVENSSGFEPDVLLYSSQYFRGIEPNQASVSIAVLPGAQTNTILVGWDDPALGKVLLKRSVDGAETWEDTLEIDHSGSILGSAAPFGLDIAAWNDTVMLVWKKRSSETNCATMFQVTTQAGGWSVPQTISEDFTGCPTSSDLLPLASGMLLHTMQVNNQLVLAAWNGRQWSDPQVQSELTGFKDAETGRNLVMNCLQLAYQPEQNRLAAVGCDLDGNQDIWVTSRSLDGIESWFSQDMSWMPPQTITSTNGAISMLHLIGSENGSLYGMWAQPQPDSNPAAAVERPYAFVMYTAWNGERWSEPSPTFRALGGGAYDLAVTLNARGDLYATWRGENPQQIFFSRANAERAYSAAEWAEAVQLPTPNTPCVMPTVLAGTDREVFVAYAVPANEGRGIYINQSTDGGRTWSEPIRIFDAQAAGWDLAGKPILTRSADGLIHAFWQKGSLLQQGLGLGLGYAQSADGGVTWSAADLRIETRVRWHDMAAPPEKPLFRAWQQISDGVPSIVTQTSTDAGTTWQEPVSITISGDLVGDPSLFADAAGGVHLLHMNRSNAGLVVLNHWIWYNDRWTSGQNLDIEQDTFQSTGLISGSISAPDKLAVIYTADDRLAGRQVLQAVISAAGQTGIPIENPRPTTVASEPTQPAPTETVLAEATSTRPAPEPMDTPTPIASPTPDLTLGNAPPPNDGSMNGVILGGIFAGFIVAAVFGYRMVEVQKRKYR
jgi:hypothetical protein